MWLEACSAVYSDTMDYSCLVGFHINYNFMQFRQIIRQIQISIQTFKSNFSSQINCIMHRMQFTLNGKYV